MTNSIFCSNCGMLKENCVCGKHKKKKIKVVNNYNEFKSNNMSSDSEYKGLDSFKKSNTKSALENVEIPKSY